MSISEKIARLRSRSKTGRDNRKPILRKLDSYKHILIVVNPDSPLSKADFPFFSDVDLYFLKARSQKEDESRKDEFTYHKADLNLTGKLKNDKLLRMRQMSFDLVLDLSADEPLGRFLLERLNQSFMIGKRDSEKSFLYDLMIEETADDKLAAKIMIEQLMLLSQNGTH